MNTGKVSPSVIRAWAVEHGWPQYAGTRGRMAAEVFEAYYKAHTPTGKPRKRKS